MKRAFLKAARIIAKISPLSLKMMGSRLPFSKFSKLISRLFWGEDIIRWHNVSVRVNPGRLHDYFLFFFGFYKEAEINKLIELCRTSRVFADVGANTGLFSLAVACACPELEVFAFEPDRDSAGDFRFNLGLNPGVSERVHIVQKAVVEKDSDLFFSPSTDRTEIETGKVIEDTLHCASDYQVSGARLDAFFRRIGKYPDVVKIDVEGAELRVLQGMKGLFEIGFPKSMLIEVHPSGFKNDCLSHKMQIKSLLEESNYALFLYDKGRQKELPTSEQWADCLHILAFRK